LKIGRSAQRLLGKIEKNIIVFSEHLPGGLH